MFEMIGSRIKVALLLALFLSPVIASAWSRQLDEWLRSDHTFEANSDFVTSVDVPN